MQHDTVPVGVIGLGDLGSRIATQLLAAGCAVRGYDTRGVTPNFNHSMSTTSSPAISSANFQLASLDEVLETCEIIHWAVPSSSLDSLPAVPETSICVLHDSVMAASIDAIAQRKDKRRFVIAHCIMNASDRVFVSTENGDWPEVVDHFNAIGLRPKTTASIDHDNLMAHSQGVFALLIKMGLRELLDTAHAAGDLTPSAEELRLAVINRESNWTPQTLESILSNPALHHFIRSLERAVDHESK